MDGLGACGQDGASLGVGEDSGQTLRWGGGRVFWENSDHSRSSVLEEGADAAVMGLEGAARHTALIAQMQEIGADLLLAQPIGRALKWAASRRTAWM